MTLGASALPIAAGRQAYSFLRSPGEIEGQVALFVYLHSYLQSILSRNDRMGMAVGLESRVPFLENEIARFAPNLPMRFKIRRTVDKWILRKTAARHLSRDLSSRAKFGFPVDISGRLRVSSSFFADGFLENVVGMGPKQLSALRGEFWELEFGLLASEVWGRIFFMSQAPEEMTEVLGRHAVVA